MAIVPWEPKEIKHLRDLFDEFFDFEIMPQNRRVDKKDVKISLSENTLSIRGERKEEKETKKEDYYCCERAFGSYSRTIALPVEIDKTKTRASYKNGMLEIVLPKTEEVKPKEIEIKPE